ncbi:hypothetical protein GQ457_10G008710 [Hibiscus cannabinus]
MAQTSAYMARTDRFIQKTYAFMDRTEMELQNQTAMLKSLETQVEQISQILNTKPIGRFPSDTEVAKGTTHEQCKAMATRSGRVLEPTDTKEARPTAEASQYEPIRPEKLEEIRPPPPFPQRLKKQKKDYQLKKFFDILKQIHINLPLVEALRQMPNYAKFLKDMVSRKIWIGELENVAATETCLALMHNKVPAKKTDPGSLTIECFIGHNYSTKALCDPGASINLISKSVFQKLGIGEAKPTTVMFQLADHLFVQPEEKIDDILVRIDKFIFPTDFLILDCKADENTPIILGRPFLATSRAVIDFDKDEIAFEVDNDQVKMKVFTTPGQLECRGRNKAIPNTQDDCTKKLKPYIGTHTERDKRNDVPERCLTKLSQKSIKEYVIEKAVPNDPGANAPRADKDKFKKHMDDMIDVGCLMLATMLLSFRSNTRTWASTSERYETSKALFQCKMSEGSPVGAHVIKMMGYIQTLEKLGFALNDELAIDVVLQSLHDSFNQFVLNFNMNEINRNFP